MRRDERLDEPVSLEAVKIKPNQSTTTNQYFRKLRVFDTAQYQAEFATATQCEKQIMAHISCLHLSGDVMKLRSMLKLGVNVDHVATLREARYRGLGRGEPDPAEAAKICEAAGAQGITIHLREDRRHIQDRDVWNVRKVVKTRLNLEMANAPEIIDIALKVKPEIVCLVPERRLEVTTEGGLDVVANEAALTETRKRMNDAGIEVSLFIAPDPAQIEASARTGSQFIELHTGSFAEHFHDRTQCEQEVARLVAGAKQARALGLQVNAGHGLNYENLATLHRVPHLIELNIGHSIVSRAISIGLTEAVKGMLKAMEGYRP
jgi:pyridoxine 5-phosphate synthase